MKKRKENNNYTCSNMVGGPLTYINNIINSDYFSNYEFKVCFQEKKFSELKLSDIKRIIKEIKEFSPDVLHIHGLQTEGFIGAFCGKKAKVKKIVTTVHGIQQDDQSTGKFKKILLKYFLEKYTLKKSDYTYCVCNEMHNREYIQKNSKKLVAPIFNFIPDNFYNNVVVNKLEDKIIISYVGRICYDKGMKELEECIKKDNNENVEYWIVGNGEYLDEMKENLKEYVSSKKVVFFGSVKHEKIKEILSQTHIFFFPTHHENLSIALLEACAMKCACIVTKVGGNIDIITNEKNGLVVNSYEVTSMCDKINLLVNNKEMIKKYSERIFEKIQCTFSEKEFFRKLNDLYLK